VLLSPEFLFVFKVLPGTHGLVPLLLHLREAKVPARQG
jgi:hypothetical protein